MTDTPAVPAPASCSGEDRAVLVERLAATRKHLKYGYPAKTDLAALLLDAETFIRVSRDSGEAGRLAARLGKITTGAADGVCELWDWARDVHDTLLSLSASAARLTEDKDEAYRQRNHLVAALARMFPSGIRGTNIPGWDAEWHGCVYIELPSGQISYHFHDSQLYLFAGLETYRKEWDGHDKEAVHARLAAIHLSPEVERLTEDNKRLRAALGRSRIALNDWMTLEASDMCLEQSVIEAQQRVSAVGTLAYIAFIQEENDEALRLSPTAGPAEGRT